MSRLDDKVSGIIIASDKLGNNKVRFCLDVDQRVKLLTKQGFTIHDTITHDALVSRIDMLKIAVDYNFTHSDSKKLVQNLLFKYDQATFREINKKNLLAEIASRPKRDTDINNTDLDKVLSSL